MRSSVLRRFASPLFSYRHYLRHARYFGRSVAVLGLDSIDIQRVPRPTRLAFTLPTYS